MINWQKTCTKFGYSNFEELPSKSLVICECDKCGLERQIRVRVKSRIINNQMKWECQKCVASRIDVSNKLKESTKKSWTNELYRKIQKEKSIRLWNDEQYRQKHFESVNTEENKNKCSQAAIKAWNNEEYRKSHAVALAKQLIVTPQTEPRFIEILNNLNIKYEHNYVVGPYSFDFAIKMDRIILIEIHGNYWHTKPYVIRKDLAKSEYVKSVPNHVLHIIWEHQLYDIDNIIKLVLRWLNLDESYEEISLSDVVYKKSSYEEVNVLMSNFHYLGNTRKGIYIGAYYKDKLIGACTLSNPVRKECINDVGFKYKEILELSRFVLSPFYRNKNLASHFLSKIYQFIPDNIKCLITYSDQTEGHLGTIYKAANWEFVSETSPSYFYINKDGWKLHKKTLYNQARKMHMKESDFAELHKYNKVHTMPLIKFKYVRRSK